MKITFVMGSGLTLAGGDRVIAIHAQCLQQRGHEVTIVTRPKANPSWRTQVKSLLKGQGWIAPKKEPSHFDNLDVPCKVIDRYRPVVDADLPDADVVIATWWETAKWVWQLSPSKGVKVHFMQDYEVWGGPVEQVDASCRLPIPKIVIVGWVWDVLQKFNQVPLALVPNSVETDKFYAPPRSKRSIPTVGLTYTTMYNKGCDISIQAYHIAQQLVPNLRLIAFGSMPVSPDLPLPSSTEYIYRAPENQLKKLYSQCDAWLFGTRIEGFGLPILEAMACRTPVIGTPAGAAPELLTDNAGILVKPENPEDMARAIQKLMQLSDVEWRAMSDAAYAKATSYTWADASKLFEAALHTAINHAVTPLHETDP